MGILFTNSTNYIIKSIKSRVSRTGNKILMIPFKIQKNFLCVSSSTSYQYSLKQKITHVRAKLKVMKKGHRKNGKSGTELCPVLSLKFSNSVSLYLKLLITFFKPYLKKCVSFYLFR